MEDEPGKYHDHSGTEEFVVVNPRGILLHFITFLDCCLGNGHISYRIFLKLAGPYISSQLEPMGKVKWEEKPKTKNISSQLLRWSMVCDNNAATS